MRKRGLEEISGSSRLVAQRAGGSNPIFNLLLVSSELLSLQPKLFGFARHLGLNCQLVLETLTSLREERCRKRSASRAMVPPSIDPVDRRSG